MIVPSDRALSEVTPDYAPLLSFRMIRDTVQ